MWGKLYFLIGKWSFKLGISVILFSFCALSLVPLFCCSFSLIYFPILNFFPGSGCSCTVEIISYFADIALALLVWGELRHKWTLSQVSIFLFKVHIIITHKLLNLILLFTKGLTCLEGERGHASAISDLSAIPPPVKAKRRPAFCLVPLLTCPTFLTCQFCQHDLG